MAGSSTELLTTVIIYGSIFLILLALYCIVRNRFPTAFNPRNSVPALQCELSTRQFGALTWMLGVCHASDRDLFEQCGLDAIAFIRILQIGLKMSLMGCLNAIYVIPVYYYAPQTNDNKNVTDNLDKCSIANMNKNDPGMYATFVASYFIFGYALFLLFQEFQWYISNRHSFLSRVSAQNYTVFVGGIPCELQSNIALHDFFYELFDDIIDVKIALDVKELEKLVMKRDEVIPKLEHANNVLAATGKRPTHKTKLIGGEEVDSVHTYREELAKLNLEVSTAIAQLEQQHARHEAALAAGAAADPSADGGGKALVRNGAFVSFRSLRSATTALQTVQHAAPFGMWVADAPLPKDVCWSNVGLPHATAQASSVLAGALTIALCVFWTIPVAIVASFSQVSSLKATFPFLQDASNASPIFDQVLAQVAPVALVVLIVILPIILTVFARMEGHVAETAVQASLFNKLTFFKVVQIFFVSAVSGSILDLLQQLADNPGPTIIDILGNKLPAQASFFMQLMLIRSFVGLGLELLRLIPCLLAALRRLLGPNLTAKERAALWMGLSPLSSPGPLDQPSLLSDVLLMFIIFLAYAALSPVTCFVMVFCFGFSAVVYRNQCMFVYDPCNDSGGKLWPLAIKAALLCIIFAELIVLAVLGLKQAAGPAVLMVPLPILTILLYRYLDQKHYKTALYLPLKDCALADKVNPGGVAGNECAQGQYLQPALQPVEMDTEMTTVMQQGRSSLLFWSGSA